MPMTSCHVELHPNFYLEKFGRPYFINQGQWFSVYQLNPHLQDFTLWLSENQFYFLLGRMGSCISSITTGWITIFPPEADAFTGVRSPESTFLELSLQSSVVRFSLLSAVCIPGRIILGYVEALAWKKWKYISSWWETFYVSTCYLHFLLCNFILLPHY